MTWENYFLNNKFIFHVKITCNKVSAFQGGVMVFNNTSDNISVILWWSVLFVEETRVTGENHQTAASH